MEQPVVFVVDVTERCVKIAGEVDGSTAPLMIDAVLTSSCVALDLSDVTFMDSVGLHALIRLRAERKALRIVGASKQVRRLLDITDRTALVLEDAGSAGAVRESPATH